MNNRIILNKSIKEVNARYEIGCYSEGMEKISKSELKKILDVVYLEYTDVDIKIRKKNYVVEIATVDNEKDFILMTREEYISRYGNERYQD